MPPPIRLLSLGLVPPWQTQAYYHAIAETMTADTPDTILLCRPNAPYLCLGYHQVFDSVLDPVECERRGLPVFRRRVGGGATYLDENQLFYQCIFYHSRVPVNFREVYARLLAAPIGALRQLELDAALHDVNEIEVGGKRIAGIGGGRIGDACVVVGNLLFDFNYDTMAAVWRVPWPSFRQLAARALRQSIVTLNQLTQTSPAEMETRLITSFAECLNRPLQPGTLTPEEERTAKRLAHTLSSPEFLTLHRAEDKPPDAAPEAMRALKISARAHIRAGETRVNGYRLRGSFHLNQEVIQETILESDPPHDWRPVEKQLHGTLFSEWQNHVPIHS